MVDHDKQRRLGRSLERLAALRLIALTAQVGTVYFTYVILRIDIPIGPLTAVLAVLALASPAVFVHARRWAGRLTERQLLAQLLVDVGALTAVLYFTGGGFNPFAACYLLIVVYASFVLPSRMVWTVAVASMASYAFLHFFHVALPLPDSAAAERAINYFTHFLVYLALAALVAGFGMRLTEMRRMQQLKAEADAQRDARERYLLRLAALSAGTTHEISTPLGTMSILVGELRRGAEPPSDWKEHIDRLWEQLQLCKRSLQTMAQAAEIERLALPESMAAVDFVDEVVERFRALRPGAPLKLRANLPASLSLHSDPTLVQAVVNFLTNAADASPHWVGLLVSRASDRLVIRILDRGTGIPANVRARMGARFVTTKAEGQGTGCGVLVGSTAIERFGGTLELSDRPGGGTVVRIELPLGRENATPEQEEEEKYDQRRLLEA